ncbi:MAG TPA: spore germination protein [Symbiobacteriaceae bacterium]|jgi:spore germination protein KA
MKATEATVAESLAHNRACLVRTLYFPENLGIEMRDLRLPTEPPVPALLVWVDGLVELDAFGAGLAAELDRFTGPAVPPALPRALTVQRHRWLRDLNVLADAVLEGGVALLVEGWSAALVLDDHERIGYPAQKLGVNPHTDIFTWDLRLNLALVRKRMRSPRLLAVAAPTRHQHGAAALLYLEGKAYPPLVRAVRRWVRAHLSEPTFNRRGIAGLPAVFGLLPRFRPTRWPDEVAKFLSEGYVVLLTDRSEVAYVAPVTQAGWFSLPSDYNLSYPLRRSLAYGRLIAIQLVLLLPGAVVALLNYHQEMLPTPFLLALASTRENAPFGLFFEVLFLELTAEVIRETVFRLPVSVPMGAGLLTMVLLGLLLVVTGFVGPLPALATVMGALLSLVIPEYSGAYLVRLWRFYFLLSAVLLGFFTMAALFAVLMAYVCQARGWGVPFLGPSGWMFSSPESGSARPQVRKGGQAVGKAKAGVR